MASKRGQLLGIGGVISCNCMIGGAMIADDCMIGDPIIGASLVNPIEGA